MAVVGDEKCIEIAKSLTGIDGKPSGELIPTGIAELDEMLQNKGYSRGSSVLISGTPVPSPPCSRT